MLLRLNRKEFKVIIPYKSFKNDVSGGLWPNFESVERETGLEPATACLEGRNSTTELLPLESLSF